MNELLSVSKLTKTYPGFSLTDITFKVLPGHIMGLIGKNGAGKSTTLKCILGMVHADGGSVCMLGRDFLAHEKDCKKDIGIVFGGLDFYPLKKLSAITAVTRKFYPEWDQAKYESYMKQFHLGRKETSFEPSLTA